MFIYVKHLHNFKTFGLRISTFLKIKFTLFFWIKIGLMKIKKFYNFKICIFFILILNWYFI